MLLESRGHEVRVAHSAAEAISIEWEPQVLVTDLRIPKAEDGLALAGFFRESMPRTKIVVLTGSDGAAPMADVLIRKPSQPAYLLETIAKLAMCLALIVPPILAQTTLPFELDRAGEAVAELEFSSPSTDWSTPGREGALAEVRVDSGEPFHVMLVESARRRYPVFLGKLQAGAHHVAVTRRPEHLRLGPR